MSINEVIKSNIFQIQNIISKHILLIDRHGTIIIESTNLNISKINKNIETFKYIQEDFKLIDKDLYFKIYDGTLLSYIIIIEDEEDIKIGKMVSLQLHNILFSHKEKFDNNHLINNLLLENFLETDLYEKLKKSSIKNSASRIVYFIKIEKGQIFEIFDIITKFHLTKHNDFITSTENFNIIVTKEINFKEQEKIDEIANQMYNDICKNTNYLVRISMGTVVHELKDISLSYKEARMAMDIGKIFNPDEYIINYKKLGIGRLVYKLPKKSCEIFINEALNGLSINSFETEILNTIEVLFENNLNLSETARKLYIHRNTLVYRLDKVQRITGIDLRNFEDSVIFKLAILIEKYFKYDGISLDNQ